MGVSRGGADPSFFCTRAPTLSLCLLVKRMKEEASGWVLKDWLNDLSPLSFYAPMFCPFCHAHPSPSLLFHPLSFPFFSGWLSCHSCWPHMSCSFPLLLSLSLSPSIFGSSSLVAKVSVGHIKAHKSLVCTHTLNHQSEVVYKSDFKWVFDYPGTWRNTEVAKRMWVKARGSERRGERAALGCFLSLLRKIEQKRIFVSPSDKS